MNAKQERKFKKVKWLFGKTIEIPEEWKNVTQSHVCQFINGYAYSKSEFREKGYPIIRIQNLTGGQNFVFSNVPLPEKQFAIDGDLLFAWSATFGPFIWHGDKAAFHYHQWKIIPNDKASKLFLFYHLTKIAPIVKQMGQSGLGMFHMTKSGMETFPIVLPPLPEQTRIASILSGIDACIEATQKTIKKTERLKKGLMQQLLTQGIGHKKFKKVKWLFGKTIEIPENWDVKKLTNIGDIVGGGTPSSKNKEYWNGDILWAVPTDITKLSTTYIDNTERKITKGGLNNSSAKLLPVGTVLITSRATIGECAIATMPISTNQGFQSIICNNTVDNVFVFYMMRFNRNTIIRLSYGTTFLEISKNEIEKIQVSVPNTIIEQEKIASILSGVDAYIQKNQEYKKKLERLKKGLMQKLLTGQIRVNT